MKRWTAGAAVVVVGLVLGTIPAQAAPSAPASPSPATDDTQTILVTLDTAGADPEATAEAAVAQAAAAVPGAEVTDAQRVTSTTVAVTVSGGLSATQADRLAAGIDRRPGVKAASKSATFHAAATNWETSLWNINAAISAHGVAADNAWGRTTGAGIIVGVVDTGITAHPDLTGSASAIVGGNVVAGYDFVRNAASGGDGDGWDSNPTDEGDAHDEDGTWVESSWHGTHVAGTIAAIKDNSGVVGVAPGAKVEPLRVLGADGGAEADVIAAVRWAVGDPKIYNPATGQALAVNPQPVKVLNLSLGGTETCSSAMQDAINYAVGKGVPVVVAAGNESSPLASSAPANCQNVIRVVASTYEGGPATDYTNYGTYGAPATISAPGGSGYHTLCDKSAGKECGAIASTVNDGTGAPGQPDYSFMWGTSMATPHVSGTLALLRSMHPEWSVATLTAALRGSTTAINGCSAVQCGAGIVNAGKAVTITNFISRKKAPSISGKFKVGKTVTAKPGSWSPKVKLSYRWLRNGAPISKATHSKYKLTKSDRRKYVTVQITVTGPAGYASRVEVLGTHKVK